MARYQAFLTPEGYARANAAFRRYWSGDRTELLQFIEQYLPPAGSTADTIAILSVGSGTGEFDESLIRQITARLPNVPLRYVAVEPNIAQAEGFRSRLAARVYPHLQLELVPSRAEEYRSPTPFDLIHYTHSIYHIAGQEERVLREAIGMLTPQGRLLIAIAMEDGGIYRAMRRFWEVIDYGAFGDGLFGQTRLIEMLQRNGLPYTSQLYPEVYIDITDCFDPHSASGQDLLNFVFQADMRQLPAEVRQQALDYLAEISVQRGDRTILYHGSGVFAIARPQHAA